MEDSDEIVAAMLEVADDPAALQRLADLIDSEETPDAEPVD